jgi:hypothetical protein
LRWEKRMNWSWREASKSGPTLKLIVIQHPYNILLLPQCNIST